MGYYAVTMVRGHQGIKQNDGLITFAYEARDLLTAMGKAKRQPGVKHSKPPVRAVAITREEYIELRKISAYERAGVKK